ncbi:MAG TPA: hypothetical protein VI413_09295 [Paludibacter sp.]|jgi:hypothetical protein
MKDKLIKKIQNAGCLILLISLCITSDFFAAETQKQNELAKNKTIASHPARASPVDSCQYSVQIDGQSNIVIINDKIMVSTPDTAAKQNNIRVTGKGNTIRIIQDDNKSNQITVIQNDTNSKVIIFQSGNNNQTKISQNKN